MYWRDEWPTNADGSNYDGKCLLELVRNGESPFRAAWDVCLLIREVEKTLDTQVVDISAVTYGANNYGFHLELSNRPPVVARLARGDVNWPGFDGFSVGHQVCDLVFETEVYDLLRRQPAVKASKLLYHRKPRLHDGPRTSVPQDILGRRLMVFERAPGGGSSVWRCMSRAHQFEILGQAASIRAALFNFDLPRGFAETWLPWRPFEKTPYLPMEILITPTRMFCVEMFRAKIKAMIRNVGDMIGWESDGNVVGPEAAAAKSSLLRFVPYMLPEEDASSPSIYRLVLEHGDFGIHNMTISDKGPSPEISSVFDWETSCIVPALVSDTLMAVTVDLCIDDEGQPALTRIDSNADSEAINKQRAWTQHYHKILFDKAPDYEKVVREGLDARHLWFALRDWRGADPEEYFGRLGAWADRRMQEIGASTSPA